jgi:formylglycine-generating enzyme required for sulfatase activity
MGLPQSDTGRRRDEAQHRVRITKPFYLGVTEVTQSEFQRVLGRNPSYFQNSEAEAEKATGPDTSRNPVDNVTWYDALEFCNKLSEDEGRRPYYRISDIKRDGDVRIVDATVGIEGGSGYQLPTEAQWEYACRAGTTTPFNFGSANNGIECNCNGNKPYQIEQHGRAHGATIAVGSHPPNAFGLHDMHGNEQQWCWDVYDESYYANTPEVDPTGPLKGALRVLRGGSWASSGSDCRSAARMGRKPDFFGKGFRVACDAIVGKQFKRPDSPTQNPERIPETPGAFGGTGGRIRTDNGLNLPLVWIPPGAFTMGSPQDEKGRSGDEDQVQVTLTKGFWLGQHVVTQREWKRVMQSTPWSGIQHVKKGDDYPATYVSWDDAMKFCEQFTEADHRAGRLPPQWKYVLPTEAQWEYACRGGTKTRFSFGDDDSELDKYAWFRRNASDAGQNYAHRVGQKKPNPWGLHEMHGNVWEWCSDYYADNVFGGRDPQGPSAGSLRVRRGGCWNSIPWNCRSAFRRGFRPGTRDGRLGFRLAAVPSGK